MTKVLVRALVLIGLGVGIGYAHSMVGERPMLRLQPQDPAKAKAPEQPKPAPVETKPEQAAGTQTGPAQSAQPAPTQPAPAGTSGATTAQAEPPKPPTVPASDGYKISIAEAKEIFDSKRAIFIDARTYTEYTQGHIPGSMHLDKKYFDGALLPKVRNYLPGMEVVIYCHGAMCTDSEAVAKRLQALNMSVGPIRIIQDGLPGWIAAGHPVDTGGEVGFE